MLLGIEKIKKQDKVRLMCIVVDFIMILLDLVNFNSIKDQLTRLIVSYIVFLIFL